MSIFGPDRKYDRIDPVASPLNPVLSRLDGVRRNGAGWKARCPAHDDRHPSLSINVGDDGRVLLKCHAGCETNDIVAALGLTLVDLFPPRDETIRANGHRHKRSQPPPPPQPRRAPAKDDAKEQPPKHVVETREFTIRDEQGHPVAIHGRVKYSDGSKDQSWKRPDGRSGLGGLSSNDLPLYGIHKRRPGQTTIVVEGEPARDALASRAAELDIAVVGTVTGAASTPSDDVLRPLLDGPVLLWPDSDTPGEAHMDKLHWRLRDLGNQHE